MIDTENSNQYSVPWSARDVWLGVGGFALWLVLAAGLVFLIQLQSWQIDAGILITIWAWFTR